MSDTIKDSGSCQCGKITFELWDFNPEYSVCHCSECRKWTGGFYACIAAKTGHYKISGTEHITWYQKKPKSEQGFCKNCGSAIFWRESSNASDLDFAIGMLNNPEQLRPKRHIFCQSKPQYYNLPEDGTPHLNQWD